MGRLPRGHSPHDCDGRVAGEPAARRKHFEAARTPPGHTLLGLYQGVPLDKRGWGYSTALPDQVTLLQGSIERAARSPREVARIVYETLWHELGHHLGMDEDEVRATEKRRGVEEI